MTLEEQRRMLLKAESLHDGGLSPIEICEILGINRGQLKALRRSEILIWSVPGPWQQEFQGKRWTDMPGFDWFSKRCNFALFRRGKTVFDMKRHGRMQAVKRGRPKRKLKADVEADDVEGVEIVPAVAGVEW